MIKVRNLTKRYGDKVAVDDLSFSVKPGRVTGFLGPNGSGKSTTMRMILGLDAPTSGIATINGKCYSHHTAPLHRVGSLLDAHSTHPSRSAFDHLMALAHTHGIPRTRVDWVLKMTGIDKVARMKAGAFSLGMTQRLGVAAALIGDPSVLIFDEPVNGLDPEGVQWIRSVMKKMARRGRTVFVSSHLMSEMALTADHLIVIGQGKLLADMSMAEFREQAGSWVRVVSPEANVLRGLLDRDEARFTVHSPDTFDVSGVEAGRIGHLAASCGIPLLELTPQSESLEDAFMRLTGESVEYRGVGR
ncbi:ABC transporter ATP-binding protein [Streptomyces sp. 5-10]|uniref:ABC transporter ATP-binding protein n=1 Tax=Streptomyces sp. 5-10 TaxID=878925 RepID=UPI00168BC221|nr:ATP-binding cassette domain-containing protein [Streptomyces sp. 5-10]MBD3004558.1 ATP-binding cassette domain-containing protein [Streptomyces sp. 5-10]